MKRRSVSVVVVASAILVVVDTLWIQGDVLSIVGAVLAALTTLVGTLRPDSNFKHPFSAGDWWRDHPDDRSTQLSVPFKRHGVRNPSVAVFRTRSDGSLEEVICSVRVESNHDVVVFAHQGDFDGEVRLS